MKFIIVWISFPCTCPKNVFSRVSMTTPCRRYSSVARVMAECMVHNLGTDLVHIGDVCRAIQVKLMWTAHHYS